jgi:hypothetical protein
VGMHFCIVQVSEFDLKEMHTDPEKIVEALEREGPEQDRPARKSGEQLALFDLPPFPVPHHSAAGSLYLEKRWHVLHFLLTGETWEIGTPLSRAIFGRIEIGEDIGYGGGPARFLTPDDVRGVTSTLSSLTHEELRQRFDPKRLAEAEIYPGNWEDWEVDWIIEDFDRFAAYYRNAAECGNGMLMAIR